MKKKIIIAVVCLLVVLGGLFVYFKFFNYVTYETVYVEGHELTIDYLKGEDGSLATINYPGLNCQSVVLTLFDNNTYRLYDKECDNSKRNCVPITVGEQKIYVGDYSEGTYDLKVLSLFGLVSAEKLSEYNKDANWVKYTLTTGKGEVFVTNNNNIPLNSLLKQINVNLETCMKQDIQD